MRMLYAADVHGDLEALERFRDFSKDRAIDIVVAAGDLIAPIFRGEDAEKFRACSDLILEGVRQNKAQVTFEQMAQHIAQHPEAPDEARQLAESYLRFTERARKNVQEQYGVIKEIFDSFGKPVLTIPGNWDTTTIDNVLVNENLHPSDWNNPSKREINGVSFGGFGASPEYMLGLLPQELEIPYSDEVAYHILTGLAPDIAITHQPVYGLCDVEDQKQKHIGSPFLALYLAESTPDLFLVGHMHRPSIDQKHGVVVINPGNLGRYYPDPRKEKHSDFGTFIEFGVDGKNYFTGAELFKIADLEKRRIEKLGEVKPEDIGLKR